MCFLVVSGGDVCASQGAKTYTGRHIVSCLLNRFAVVPCIGFTGPDFCITADVMSGSLLASYLLGGKEARRHEGSGKQGGSERQGGREAARGMEARSSIHSTRPWLHHMT